MMEGDSDGFLAVSSHGVEEGCFFGPRGIKGGKWARLVFDANMGG